MRFGTFDHLNDDGAQFSQLFEERIMQAYIALPHQAYFWLGGLGNARLPPHTYKRHAGKGFNTDEVIRRGSGPAVVVAAGGALT